MTTTTAQIRYLQRHQLDVERWDNCLTEAGNGLIYGYSVYLDAMADNWDALVLADYEAVMPLPWRRKGGIYYLYQPFLTAQLGVFGNGISAQTLSFFLQAVPKKFRYWDFPLNYRNVFPVQNFPIYQRLNFVLPLDQPYEILVKGYRENIRRNIKKCLRYGGSVTTEITVPEIFSLNRFQSPPGSPKEEAAFATLVEQVAKKGMGKLYGIRSARGELLAAAVFLFSHHRAYYLLVGNHPNGRTLGASHALVDAFIADHAGQNLVLDFEGSDISSLAFFYSSFGASEERYAAIRLNRLPWWLKWLK